KAKEARPVARPVAVPAPPLPEAPAGVRELLAPQVDATLAAIDAAVEEAKEGLLVLVPEPSPAPQALAAVPPEPPRAAAESKKARAPKESTGPFWKKELSLPGQGSDADLSTVLGLRIGSSQLAAALVHNNGSAELLQLARTPLKSGVVSGGEVRDTEALANALKRFFAQHKLPRRGVRLGVATNRIGVRVLDMPLMEDPTLLGNAIRFRAQEVL